MKNARLNELELIVDFSSPTELAGWSAVDDVVMGGVSSSRLRPTSSGSASFEGELSLEQGGGFASVRSGTAPRDLAELEALSLMVRGDGKRYQLRLRTSKASDDVTYRAGFDTLAGTWQILRFGAADFVPSWRGRVVRDAPALDFGDVLGFGLMIADQQAGAFALELAWIAKAVPSE